MFFEAQQRLSRAQRRSAIRACRIAAREQLHTHEEVSELVSRATGAGEPDGDLFYSDCLAGEHEALRQSWSCIHKAYASLLRGEPADPSDLDLVRRRPSSTSTSCQADDMICQAPHLCPQGRQNCDQMKTNIGDGCSHCWRRGLLTMAGLPPPPRTSVDVSLGAASPIGSTCGEHAGRQEQQQRGRQVQVPATPSTSGSGSQSTSSSSSSSSSASPTVLSESMRAFLDRAIDQAADNERSPSPPGGRRGPRRRSRSPVGGKIRLCEDCRTPIQGGRPLSCTVEVWDDCCGKQDLCADCHHRHSHGVHSITSPHAPNVPARLEDLDGPSGSGPAGYRHRLGRM